MPGVPSLTSAWSPWRKGYTLGMLLIALVFASVDRQLVSILLLPIKHDLNANDTEMGLLTGLWFSLFHGLLSIPLARMADYNDRRRLIGICIALWSAATMACGIAMSYTQIAAARMAVAVGEAGNVPAGHSILAQIFSPRVRARVFGILAAGSGLGLAFGIFLGGTLNQALGWRNVFLVVGAPGLLFAMLFTLTVKEPYRPNDGGDAQRPSVRSTLGELWRIPTYRLVLFTCVMGGSAGFGMLAWMPTLLVRVHGLSSGAIGVRLGLATMVGVLCGNVLGGALADRLARRSQVWLVRTYGIGLILCTPVAIVMALCSSATLSIVAFSVFMAFLSFYPPLSQAASAAVVDLRSRALASAIVGLCITLGGAIGPLFIGAMNDMLNASHGELGIRISVAATAAFALIGGLAAVTWGGAMARDYKVTQAAV